MKYSMFIAIIGLMLGIILMLSLKQALGSYTQASLQQFHKIKALIEDKNYFEAQTLLTPLLKKKNAKKEAFIYQIQIYHGTGKLEEAYEMSLKFQKKWKLKTFQLQEAISLLLLDRNEEAATTFMTCQDILEKESEKFYFATALYRIERFNEALSILRPYQYITKEPKLAALVASCMIKLEKYDEVVGYLTSMLQEQENFLLQTQLAEAYLYLEEIPVAIVLFEKLYQSNSSTLLVLLGFATCLEKIGEYKKAISLLQSSQFWETQEPSVLNQAIYPLLYLHKYSEAEVLLKNMLSQKPGEIALLAELGLCLEKQDKFQEAEDIYLQILEKEPNNLPSMQFLVWLRTQSLSQKISIEKALEMAHKMVHISPQIAHWELLSLCEALAGNFQFAIKILLSLLQQDQNVGSRVRRQRIIRQLKQQLTGKNASVVEVA